MQIIRSHDYRRMPWKNGGGETVEIVVSPAGAPIDAFDWRISMAHVTSDGPVSIFPEIDRTLLLLTGDGIILDIVGRGSIRLDCATPPYAFPGDIPVASRLVGGAVADFNVMTRRGRFRHHLSTLAVDAPMTFTRAGDITLAVLRGASALVDAKGERLRMEDGDTLMFEGADRISLAPDAAANLLIVDLWRR
ncbi:HutD family protein [Terrarubrum flagellatum]|uniref:HutD/Ves family protein n=1 Tax=Terrirubrum flagellatum TaxID=2895980 RepID=UPI00314533F5